MSSSPWFHNPKIWLRILGSAFSAAVIALVFTSKDCEDKEGLNYVILGAQILMVALLWTGNWFSTLIGCRYWKISYLAWVWFLLYAVSSSCFAFRFKGKGKKLMNTFLIGNAILLVLALAQNQTTCKFLTVTEADKKLWKEEVLQYSKSFNKSGNVQERKEALHLENLLRNHGEGAWVDENSVDI